MLQFKTSIVFRQFLELTNQTHFNMKNKVCKTFYQVRFEQTIYELMDTISTSLLDFLLT